MLSTEQMLHRYHVAVGDATSMPGLKISQMRKYSQGIFYCVARVAQKSHAEGIASDYRDIGFHARVIYQKSNPASWRWSIFVRRK